MEEQKRDGEEQGVSGNEAPHDASSGLRSSWLPQIFGVWTHESRFLTFIGLGGAGALQLWPDSKWFGIALLVIGFGGAALVVLHSLVHRHAVLPEEPHSNISKWAALGGIHWSWLKNRSVDRMVLRYGRPAIYIVFVVGIVIIGAVYYWPSRQPLVDDITSKALAPLPAPPSAPPAYLAAIRGYSRAQLQARAIEMANELRAFEAGFDSGSRDQLFSTPPLAGGEQEKHDQFRTNARARIGRIEQKQLAFRTRFLPECLALRDEILKRQGSLPPWRPTPDSLILEDGSLYGANPLSRLAVYMESIARGL